MTRIDFYILPDIDQQSPFDYTARLVQKVYRRGHEIYIHTADHAQSEAISDALWQRQDGFLAHQCGNNPAQPHCRIQVSHEQKPGEHGDVMINLAGEVPAIFSRFERVLEIVPGRPQDREQSRTNYQFYRDRGYTLKTHNIS